MVSRKVVGTPLSTPGSTFRIVSFDIRNWCYGANGGTINTRVSTYKRIVGRPIQSHDKGVRMESSDNEGTERGRHEQTILVTGVASVGRMCCDVYETGNDRTGF